MKNFLLVILVIVFFLPVLASGEQTTFSYRNDIKFGDTIAEVKGKESISPESEDKGFLYYGKMVLSTIGNSGINYNFSDGKLTRIIVDYNQNYGGYDNVNNRNAEYEKINDGLIRKYGKPDVTSEEDATIYPFGGLYWYNNYHESKSYSEQQLISITQWLINDGINDISIEHVLFEVQSSDWGNPKYCVHMLTYQLCDDKLNTELDQSIDNDL